MNKKEFIEVVASQHNLSNKEADEIVKTVFDTIKKALAEGDEVAIPGFGGFKATKRAARQGRNPRTGEALTIAAAIVPQFKAASALKDALNEK